MAAFTKTVKLAVVGGAALPLIGYSGRLFAATASDNDQVKYIRACDIPMYRSSNVAPVSDKVDNPEPNNIQTQITTVRKYAGGVIDQITDGYDKMMSTAQIGVEHSRATLDFVQTNPGELPRITFISLATMGGIIMGYRRSILRKVLYASVAGLSSAALCYPNFTVELSMALREDAKVLWKNNIGWPFSVDEKAVIDAPKGPMESNLLKKLKGKEDHGQSKAEDKDLYSTRS